MFDFRHISGDALARLNELADRVCSVLERAGIPVYRTDDNPTRPGAEVQVDTGDDEAGGVFVRWRVSPELTDRASVEVRSQGLDSFAVRHAGETSMYMRDAIIGILVSAGFNANDDAGDYRPLEDRILGYR